MVASSHSVRGHASTSARRALQVRTPPAAARRGAWPCPCEPHYPRAVDNESRKRVEIRVSDVDRERVVDVLREAFAEGRLTADEHAERVDAAYAARTQGELVPLTADLPAHRPQAEPLPKEPAAPPGEPTKLLAVFGETRRKGRWRAGGRLRAVSVFGNVQIDLTEAVFTEHEVVITATSVFGAVDIRVPEGVTLRGSGAGIFGSFDIRQEESAEPGAPVVTVHGAAVFGAVEGRRRRAKVRDALADRLRKELDKGLGG